MHSIIAILFFLMVMFFYWRQDKSIINTLLALAGITYGPLLGLFAFGMTTKFKVLEAAVPIVCIASAVTTYLLRDNSAQIFWGYKIGHETLLINAALTYIGLMLIRRGSKDGPLIASSADLQR